MVEGLTKYIPWKTLRPWAIIILIVDLSLFILYEKHILQQQDLILYAIFLSFMLCLVELICDFILNKAKIGNQKKASAEMIFEKEVTAPDSEFGGIKGSNPAAAQTKMTFQGKVDAPRSKFGNIEQ